MGVTVAPDFPQGLMDNFCELAEVDVYLDNFDVFSTTWDTCLLSLIKVNHLLACSDPIEPHHIYADASI